MPDTGAGEQEHDFPWVLPGGRSVLFSIWRGGRWGDGDIGLLDLDTGKYQVIHQKAGYPAYLDSGYLVYARSNELYAVVFDPVSGQVSGVPSRMTDDVLTAAGAVASYFAVSSNGTLLQAVGEGVRPDNTLAWLTSDGSIVPIETQDRVSAIGGVGGEVRLSADGKQILFTAAVESYDIHRLDLDSGVVSIVSSHPAWEGEPVWSPDGTRVMFGSARAGAMTPFVADLERVGDPEVLLPPGEVPRFTTTWSSAGVIAYYETGQGTRDDIWTLSLEPGSQPIPLADTRFNERWPIFAPDGRFVAFESDATERPEIYIAPYPPTGERPWRVSRGGGAGQAVWARDGRTLYYNGGDRIMAVALGEDARPTGEPEPWSPEFPRRFGQKDVDVDGQRVLGVLLPDLPPVSWLQVVTGWDMEVELRMADGR